MKKFFQISALAVGSLLLASCSGDKVENAIMESPLNEYMEFTEEYSEFEVHYIKDITCIDVNKGHYYSYFEWIRVEVPVKKIKEFPEDCTVWIFASIETEDGEIDLVTPQNPIDYAPDLITTEMIEAFENFRTAPVGTTATLVFYQAYKPGYFDYSIEKAKENRDKAYSSTKESIEKMVDAIKKGKLKLYDNGLAIYLQNKALQDERNAAIEALQAEVGNAVVGTWEFQKNESTVIRLTFGENGEYQFVQETTPEVGPKYTITMNGAYGIAENGGIETTVPVESISISFDEGFFPNEEIADQAKIDMMNQLFGNTSEVETRLALDQNGGTPILRGQFEEFTKVN